MHDLEAANRLEAIERRLQILESHLSKQSDALTVLTSLILDLQPKFTESLRTIYEKNLAAVETARKQKGAAQILSNNLQNSPVQ